MKNSPFGVSVLTHPAGTGLQMTALGLARSLERHGVPCFLAGIGRTAGEKLTIAGEPLHALQHAGELVHPVNLYVMPLLTFERLFTECPWLAVPGRMHVASMWWEASTLPPAWIANVSRFDAVLAASSFIANVAANDLHLTPVIEMRHPLTMPAHVATDRARFGLADAATVFCVSFDPTSDPARKNPMGAIEAFRMAFPDGGGSVQLVIRLSNADTGLGPATVKALQEPVAGDARIRLLTDPMSYSEVLSLYASSDVYVSLHRGEGLGLGLMESMALGKPVVATAWSGNVSFMDHGCACPVRYAKTPVRGNWPFFKPEMLGDQAFWAEPMLDDAAAWMKKLHEDPEMRSRIGAAARVRFEDYQREACGRSWIDQLEALWRAREFLPRAPGKLSGK